MDHRNWGRRKNWIDILEWSCLNLFGRRHARWSVRTRPFICNILLKTRLTVVFNCLCDLYYLYCMKDSKLRLALRYCSNLTFDHYCSTCSKIWHTWSECAEDGHREARGSLHDLPIWLGGSGGSSFSVSGSPQHIELTRIRWSSWSSGRLVDRVETLELRCTSSSHSGRVCPIFVHLEQ